MLPPVPFFSMYLHYFYDIGTKNRRRDVREKEEESKEEENGENEGNGWWMKKKENGDEVYELTVGAEMW